MKILLVIFSLALTASAQASDTVLQCVLAVGPISHIKIVKKGSDLWLNQVRFSGEQHDSVLPSEEWESKKIYLNNFDGDKSDSLVLSQEGGSWSYRSVPGAAIDYIGQADCSPWN